MLFNNKDTHKHTYTDIGCLLYHDQPFSFFLYTVARYCRKDPLLFKSTCYLHFIIPYLCQDIIIDSVYIFCLVWIKINLQIYLIVNYCQPMNIGDGTSYCKTLLIIFTKLLFHPPLSPTSAIIEKLTPFSEPFIVSVSPPHMPLPVVLLSLLLVFGK